MTQTRLLLLLLFCISLGSISPARAQELEPLAPIIFITEEEIIRWDESNQFVTIAEMPTPSYVIEGNRPRLIWRDAVVSPNRQYVAYAVTTPEWQDVIGNDAVRDGDRYAANIYIVDLATGQTKPIALQDVAEPRQQIRRWSLDWTHDSQHLIWMENMAEGDLILYDLATSQVTTLVEDVAPYYSYANVITEDRILTNDLSVDSPEIGITLYALDGTLIREIGALNTSESFVYTYYYDEDETRYYGTNIERIDLATGEMTPMPAGQLVQYAASAPENSLRLSAATYGDEGCTVDVLTSDLLYLERIVIHNPVHHSPDGSAILFYDAGGYYVILRYVAGEGLVRTQLPDMGAFPYVIAWGDHAYELNPIGDEFVGRFLCASG